MCARYLMTFPRHALQKRFGVKGDSAAAQIRTGYNISPSSTVVSVIIVEGERRLVALRWGLIPSWSKDEKIASRTINAKAETLSSKPSFAAAYKKRRCMIPANGFYEWRAISGKKTPYLISLKDNGLFGFAGLYEGWKAPDGSILETCTVITTEPNELIKPIHDRMPAIVAPDDESDWLDISRYDEGRLRNILRPYPDQLMECVEVSSFVNNPRHDGAECVKRAGN